VKLKVDADITKDNGMALKTVLKAAGGDAKVRELCQLLAAAEAAAFLSLDLGMVRNLIYRRELPCVKVGPPGCEGSQVWRGA